MNFHLPAAIPELPVTNLDNSIDYYKKCLGFSVDWQYEDGICGVSNGNMCLFLNKKEIDEAGKTTVWLNLESKEQMDQLYNKWAENGAEIVSIVETKPWGLYEFTITDPDKNKIRVYFDLNT
jgi:uncharacterized glyoxalase superfamily protein PhnB